MCSGASASAVTLGFLAVDAVGAASSSRPPWLCSRLFPSSGLCVSVHPCMEIDWRHEYITTSHPCLPHLAPSLLHPSISPRSLSQHLSQSSDLMHFNRRVYLPFSPFFSFFFDFGSVASFKQATTTKQPLPPHLLPLPCLNQYLPSANKSYNFLTVRRVRRRHIYLPLVTFFAVDLCFSRRGY